MYPTSYVSRYLAVSFAHQKFRFCQSLDHHSQSIVFVHYVWYYISFWTLPLTSVLAIIVRGRFAGRKVVVVKPHDEGTKSHPFPHAIVAGIDRYPLKVHKAHGAKKVAKRTKIKPFVKVVNYNHLFPTRYTVEVENIKTAVTTDALSEPTQRSEAKKVVKKAFEEKHQTGKNKWFFTKLNF